MNRFQVRLKAPKGDSHRVFYCDAEDADDASDQASRAAHDLADAQARTLLNLGGADDDTRAAMLGEAGLAADADHPAIEDEAGMRKYVKQHTYTVDTVVQE